MIKSTVQFLCGLSNTDCFGMDFIFVEIGLICIALCKLNIDLCTCWFHKNIAVSDHIQS